LLSDFDTLMALVNEAFDLPDKAKETQREQRLVRPTPGNDIPKFFAEFDALTDELHWPTTARKTLFFTKLPKALQEEILTNDEPESYSALKKDALSRSAIHKALNGPERKCDKCGRTNHETKDCFAKTTVNMIRTSNNANAPPSHCYIDGVMIQGIARRALADTGSALFGPTGKALVIDANYIVETIDGIPQKLYIVPGLTEEVILGEPYFTRATPVDILHINTWDEPVDGGRLRRLSAPELEALDGPIITGLEDGLVRPSQAGVAANVIVVPKKDRICVDYCKLNAVTKPDKYPLPLIRDLLETAVSHLHFRSYNS